MTRIAIYAVTGSPVLHSLSPLPFRRAFDICGIEATYTRLAADTAAKALRFARTLGIRGMNVTSPFKEDIAPLMDDLDPSATTIDAVNTVLFTDDKALGYNLDASGVLSMVAAADFDPSGKRISVLGAGGAAKAAAAALKGAGAAVSIVNRGAERGMLAADRLGVEFVPLAKARDAIRNSEAVVACWPQGDASIDPGWLSSDAILFDANYHGSAFAEAARAAGCRYVDGRQWLVGQAEACFELFTGKAPPEEAMRTALDAAEGGADRHIVLAGMMGSGKSEVGRRLAESLKLKFTDTDAEVEHKAERSIADIFAGNGEAEFRRLERDEVRCAMDRPRSVVALGGGALTDEASIDLICRAGTVIWLWASPEVSAARADAASRPLIDAKDPRAALDRILESRFDHYARAASLIVDTDDRTADAVAGKIADEIDSAREG